MDTIAEALELLRRQAQLETGLRMPKEIEFWSTVIAGPAPIAGGGTMEHSLTDSALAAWRGKRHSCD
ncbi:MAG: hypothetical protein ACLQBA_04060 [Candidatus Binataceae bacterium]